MFRSVTPELVVEEDCQLLFERSGLSTLNDFMAFSGGERVCHKPGRSVYRFALAGRVFYLKRNRFHWGEFLKRLSRFSLPPRSGKQEWENILKIKAAGIATVKPIAFGEKHLLGVEVASFSVTEEIYAAEPLDEVIGREWCGLHSHVTRLQKRRIIRNLAQFAGGFHRQGMNHQDFYLNHFFIDQDGKFYLLDLQRVQQRPKVPERYLVKDLAQLSYSSRRFACLSATDKMYFMLNYYRIEKLNDEIKRMIQKINTKTARISRHDAKHRLKRIRRGELSAMFY